MKLKKYITEEDGPFDEIDPQKMADWRDILNKECKPFVKEVGLLDSTIDKSNIFQRVLFRGFKDPPPDWRIEKAKVRTDRRPRYIPLPMHENLSKITKKMYGWNTRAEGLFTGSHEIASQFSTSGVRVVIPIGPIKYVYMGGEDLHNLYVHFDIGATGDIEALTELVSKYKTKGLRNYMKQNSKERWECIVKCSSYYIMSMDTIKSVTWDL
jgi:hypothetical protein